MLRLFGYPLAVLALFAMAGGHWAVLKTVAWAGMLSERIEHRATLRQALSETFDGNHPCPMCRHIAAAKRGGDDTRKSTPAAPDTLLKSGKKAEAVSSSASFSSFPALVGFFSGWPTERCFFPLRIEAPPVPPPRELLSASV